METKDSNLRKPVKILMSEQAGLAVIRCKIIGQVVVRTFF